MATTYDRVIELLVSRFEVDPAMIRPGVTFEELEMDSLFLVEFLLTIQSDWGVKVSEDSASAQDTIEQAAELIDAHLGAATGS
ncbi:MAG TPA: phosphopantetheine-binding protein [Streptosporangiaceae bacterium]|jgi:acyl carrier protein